jgi:adenine-specific DNA-methyltransferase
LYGLFAHKAFQLLNPQGVLAYVTPTGFLGGEYFKKLRSFIRNHGTPIEVDFVSARKGIFDDVLQETMLLTIKEGITSSKVAVAVNEIIAKSHKQYESVEIGIFHLPKDNNTPPWIFPRNKMASGIIHTLNTFTSCLKDWGFEVSTGPLVWNRHKGQLYSTPSNNCFPLIWAESITPEGNFQWKADKRNHTLYCKIESSKQQWLKTKVKCLLMQRTTAKEQGRRLNTALLDERLIEKHGAVVIENHVNIIKPINKAAKVSLELLHLFLNSKAADSAFRCISGSVAVSAYELETMPLPTLEKMIKLDALLKNGVDNSLMELEFLKLYNLNA